MKSAIEELFDAFETYDEGAVSPEERRVRQNTREVWGKLEKKLTLEETDALWSSAVEVGAAECQASFRRGFLLGSRLMLEVMGADRGVEG